MQTILLIPLLGNQIPGAVAMTQAVNRRIDSVERCLLADDAKMVYVMRGGIERFLILEPGGLVGTEMLHCRWESGTPHSRTDSQEFHFRSVRRPDTVYAKLQHSTWLSSPTESVVLAATRLEDRSVRLTVVRLAERGEYPNTDYEVTGVGYDDRVVAAERTGGKPIWYLLSWEGSSGAIERLTVEDDRLTRSRVLDVPEEMKRAARPGTVDPVFDRTTPYLGWQYDPAHGVLVTLPDSEGAFALWSSASTDVRVVRAPHRRVFLWRGGVYSTGENRTMKLNDRFDWEVFCGFSHIGMSTNGRYWIVRDTNGIGWLADFGTD